ncbi:hypothetical protein DOTSEDRAFT_75286 [Dothistroma septosporum NZE10]|uniref:F-box domain-containing protein n=1 Tax=Dothistroma septosporum (strain NZE10 / CBS 128990) TaxID=675120 RepID=M2XJD7_DOTSN|nr:hypothetical protein DOTSEDRAFT_75286 [Dothistroma septosporum NZE10]
MGIVAWELYHLECYRQWPELPEVAVKGGPQKTVRRSEGDRTRAATHTAGTAASSCSRVFGIAELAQEIFLRLHQSDLLCRAQQVCRQWHMIITSTRAIREHLFLDSISDVQPWLITTSYSPVLSTEQPNTWAESEQACLSRTIIENPFLPLLDMGRLLSEPFARPDATWRNMLVTQPGLLRISWWHDDHASLGYVKTQSQGLTMGELADSEAVPGALGWSAWKAYGDYHQLKALRAEMRLSLDRLRELREWSCAGELPEYEVWEEKTSQSMRLDL